MPERPGRPSTPGILNDIVARLRALERTRPGFVPPKGDDFIELWDEGVPQGLVKSLDFVGSGVQVETTGDERGLVNISGGGTGGWDAIVDGTLAASDPEARLFMGIGEALTYLANVVGLTSCVVAVRPFDPSVGNGYEETANWASPGQTRLFGLRGVLPTNATAEADGFYWHWNGWRPSSVGNLRIENCAEFEPGSMASGGVQKPFSIVWAYDTYVDFSNFPASVGLCTQFFGVGCTFDMPNAVTQRLATSKCVMVQCDGANRGSSLIPAGTGSGSELLMIGCRWIATTSAVWTLPEHFAIDIAMTPNRAPGSLSGGIQFTVPTNGWGKIRCEDQATNGFSVVATGDFIELLLEGSFGPLTLTGAHNQLEIVGRNEGAHWQVTGPALMHCSVFGTARFTFRGNGVGGQVAGAGLTAGLGGLTFLDFIAADRCELNIGVDGTGSGACKSYAFDASSDNNVLVFANPASFAVAGTNAGTNNRILPEGAAPPAAGFAPADADFLVGTANGTLTSEIVVGPTPGGELGNTWAAPTVDATHSGSAHADFIAKAFLDAKGDLISATADNTPALVAVGADGKVLTADSTDPAGVSWQPGGGSMTFGSPVESQFGNTGADGIGTDAARDDHVHDRHDDGVLFFSGINH